MAVSATQGHSSVPRIGRWKRTLPRWNGSTAPTSRPISPSTVPSAVPTRVLCWSRRNTRNQSATMAMELIPQTSSCRVSDRSATTSISSATSRAPSPNQNTKKDGMASSSSINSTPATSQYHHWIVIRYSSAAVLQTDGVSYLRRSRHRPAPWPSAYLRRMSCRASFILNRTIISSQLMRAPTAPPTSVSSPVQKLPYWLNIWERPPMSAEASSSQYSTVMIFGVSMASKKNRLRIRLTPCVNEARAGRQACALKAPSRCCSQRKHDRHCQHGEQHHQQREGHTDLQEVGEAIAARAQHQGVHRRRDRGHEGRRGGQRNGHGKRVGRQPQVLGQGQGHRCHQHRRGGVGNEQSGQRGHREQTGQQGVWTGVAEQSQQAVHRQADAAGLLQRQGEGQHADDKDH